MNHPEIWPEGKSCCVCVSFDLDAEWVFMGNIPETADMPKRLSLGKYAWDSNALPRLFDVLKKYNVKATFFVPGINAQNHPDVMQEIYRKGHELACHGWKHERVDNIPKEEERERLLKSIAAIEKATGVRPVGHRSSGGELSPNTLDLLIENEFIYDSSLRNNDIPYFLRGGTSAAEKDLIIVPSYFEMDDFHLFADYPGTKYNERMLSPGIGYDIWTNAFDGYYKFGLCYTTMFHPQIMGKPGNIMLLDRLLAYIDKFPNVWFARADEIARYWMGKAD